MSDALEPRYIFLLVYSGCKTNIFMCNQEKFQIFGCSTMYFVESSYNAGKYLGTCHYFLFNSCLLSLAGNYSKQNTYLESFSYAESSMY